MAVTEGLLEWPTISLENTELKSWWEPHSSPPAELTCVEGMNSAGLFFSFDGHQNTYRSPPHVGAACVSSGTPFCTQNLWIG